jgi:4'-phosphopantetheinyl transferase
VVVGPAESIVWWCRVAAFEDCSLLNEARLVLNDVDRVRLAALAPSQQNVFVLSRLLMEMMVRATLGDWAVVVHAYGTAPRLESQNDAPRQGSFKLPALSLTHCNALAVVALSACPACGVDAEELRNLGDLNLVTALIFNERDKEQAACLLAHQENEHVLRVWTAKESVLKALGTGLAVPPTDVVLAGGLKARATASLKDHSSSRWDILSLELPDGHVGSLAVPSGSTDEPALVEREIGTRELEVYLSRADPDGALQVSTKAS